MAKDKLDGSFSGLWSCELCGHTGAECRCEHFARWGGGVGPNKELTGPEIAAEMWRSAYHFYRTGSEEAFQQFRALQSIGEYNAYIE